MHDRVEPPTVISAEVPYLVTGEELRLDQLRLERHQRDGLEGQVGPAEVVRQALGRLHEHDALQTDAELTRLVVAGLCRRTILGNTAKIAV